MIEAKWNYLQKVNPTSQGPIRFYAKFLLEILNDK
jgi:PAS domain S-box-containing protein